MGAINQKTGIYKIDNTVVTDPQTPSKFQLNTTGIFQRNMSATRTGRVVANMKKLFWSYKRLTKTQLDEICAVIYSKLASGSDVFTVQTKILGSDAIYVDKYYLGQPFEIQTLENPNLYKLDIHWIQVEGKLGLGDVVNITGVTASPAILGQEGGDVSVIIMGTGLSDGIIVGAYIGDELIGQTALSQLSNQYQTATLTIPENTGSNRSLTIKVKMFSDFDSHTATVTQSGEGGE